MSHWAITVGLLGNLTTSILFLITITLDRPLAALLFGYALSVPYNALATVGVSRSAAWYQGPAAHADLDRIAVSAVMLLMTVT